MNRSAYKVTDKDVARLKAYGYDEDELFELTVSASLGNGRFLHRFGYTITTYLP